LFSEASFKYVDHTRTLTWK